jgi:hypothetical protein
LSRFQERLITGNDNDYEVKKTATAVVDELNGGEFMFKKPRPMTEIMPKSVSMSFKAELEAAENQRKRKVTNMAMSSSSDSLNSSSLLWSKQQQQQQSQQPITTTIPNQHPYVSTRPRMKHHQRLSRSNLTQLKSLSTMNIPRELSGSDYAAQQMDNCAGNTRFGIIPPSMSLNNINMLLNNENFESSDRNQQQSHPSTTRVNNYMILPNVSVSEFIDVIRQNLSRNAPQSDELDQKTAEDEARQKLMQLVALQTDIDGELFCFVSSLLRLLALMLPPSNKVY